MNKSKSTFKSPRSILSHNTHISRSADQQFTSAANTPGGFSAFWLQFRTRRVPRVVDTGQSNSTGVWKDTFVTLEFKNFVYLPFIPAPTADRPRSHVVGLDSSV